MPQKVRIKVGSISWIHQQLTPTTLIDGKLLEPNWIPQTYIGLYATKNPLPPANVDMPTYRNTKQFRSMTYAELDVETSDDKSKVLSVKVVNSILDPGWTPPFDRTAFLLTRVYVPDPSMADTAFYAAEMGAGSSILAQKRHPNTTIAAKIPQDDLVASGLVFFRAGKHTDDIGVNVVKSPYHVPWVWCEWVVAHKAGKFTMYGTGSIFPTHTFYAQGKSFAQQDEPMDAAFTQSWRHPLTIDTAKLRVYPALIAGAPASGPQAADTTKDAIVPASYVAFAVSGSGYNSEKTF